MQDQETLVFAGPLSTPVGGMSGEGLIIYRASSLGDARAIADADPMYAEGCRSYTIKRWLINEGHIPTEIRALDD